MSDGLAGLVRIPAGALQEIPFCHVRSGFDLSLSSVHGADRVFTRHSHCGYTEWAATFVGASLTLGWDWALVRELIVVLNPTAMRTNLQFILEDGQIEPPPLTRIRLLEHLETLTWRPFVEQLVRTASDSEH